MNGDGKMDINEFSVACKLINLKLKGMELPKSLPPQLMNSGAAMGMGGMVHPTSLPLQGGMRPMQPGMPGELVLTFLILFGDCILCRYGYGGDGELF